MSTLLHCDGPTCETTAGDPARAARWWRLERQGDLPLSHSSLLQPLMMPTISFGLDDDDDDEIEPEFGDTPVLHFCSSGCLASWATAAHEFDT